jgi:hypothetical protein
MTIKIDQALIANFIAANYGMPIASENLTYTPIPGTAYAELTVVPTDRLGQSFKETDELTGTFRVILRFPENESSGPSKSMADLILTTFKVGSAHTYEGVTARMRKTNREPGYPEDGWYKTVLTMSYHALLTR